MEYGNTIWYPFLRKDIESVEKIQKRAAKLIPELKDMTYTERLKKLKLPSLAHRRRRGDMIQTFKIIKGIEDIPSERFFKLCTSSSTHGHLSIYLSLLVRSYMSITPGSANLEILIK